MRLTVGIPVYNCQKYIAESIRSVLAQTYTDFELIVTDDGSTDGTLDIVRSFTDSRIIVVADGMHKGLAIRLNEQIAMAQGDYFARMDADDVMLPQRLERQMAFINKHPETDVVGSSTVIIDEEGNKIGYRSACSWKAGMNRTAQELSFVPCISFMHPTVIGKISWFRKYYYNPACEGCEDQDLWARSVDSSVFYNICEPLLLYRDPQKLDLDTYIFRRRQERYVLRLNREHKSFFTYSVKKSLSYAKSVMAWGLSILGKQKWIVKSRNVELSPLNNRVLHVITSLRTGGAEKLMVDLLPRLRDLNNDVELLVFDGINTPFYNQVLAQGIKVHKFGDNCSVYNPLFVLRLIPFLRRFDYVHTHNTSCQLFVAIANLFADSNIFTTEHNTTNRRRGCWYWKIIDRWMYRQYSKIVCISDQARLNLQEYLGNKQCLSAEVIYNGVDTERYSKALTTVSEDRKNQKVITMVAAFREQKDQMTLIKAMASLPEHYILQLVGKGDNLNRLEQCKSLSRNLGIENRVNFMGIRMDIPAILQASDVVVLSSHYEGLSLSSIEGMASGKPFIASDVDGLHEIVDGYGILVPHEDDKSLSAAICKCCDDAEYAKRIGERCQLRAKQFDISVMAEKYNNLYYSKE